MAKRAGNNKSIGCEIEEMNGHAKNLSEPGYFGQPKEKTNNSIKQS